MSRETLLDDAIAKAKEAEDWQLVEWLRMARGGESAARWYTAKLSEASLDISNLMTENVKLRELVVAFDWCTENFDTPNRCDRCPLKQSDALEPECERRMRELGVMVEGNEELATIKKG